MRARPLVALVVVVLAGVAGCADTRPPTAPARLTFSGQWAGTFDITHCEVTGMYRDCLAFAPGTTHPVWLGLQQQGRSVSGIGGYGVAEYARDYGQPRALWRSYYQPFTVLLKDDRSFSVSFTLGKAPSTIDDMTFDVELSSSDEIRGTLRARNYWYKVSGDYTVSGPIRLRRVPRD